MHWFQKYTIYRYTCFEEIFCEKSYEKIYMEIPVFIFHIYICTNNLFVISFRNNGFHCLKKKMERIGKIITFRTFLFQYDSICY